jgi:hypothetical protein
MRLPRLSELQQIAKRVPRSIRFAVPVLAAIGAALPMAGMSNMHGTTWAYGQPLPFLDFYDSGGWSLVSKFRVGMDIFFWSVLLGGLALTCSWLHERFGERFSSRQAFFGFVFGVGICLAEVLCPILYRLSDWAGLGMGPACIPTMIVGTFFAQVFDFDAPLNKISAVLVLFGCAVPGSLCFARGVKVYRSWSGLAVATIALACFSFATLF